CEIKARADWKPLAGTLTGPTEFRFSTGGPAVQRTQPWSGARIDEDQLFLLELTGPVVEAELPAKAWCEVEGLAERLPVKLAAPAERDAILKARRVDPARTAALVLGCGRPLPPQAKLRLVWGKGILSAGEARVPTTVEQRFNFQVRPAFTAEFSCERERANAPCMPIRSLVVRFSSPVPRDLALQARLQPVGGGAALAPKVDKDDSTGDLSEVRFSGGLTERTRYQVVLPAPLKDASGRALANAASFPLAVATGEAPPIAKFAAAPFGVVEWKAEPLLPVTLRHVQGDLRPAAPGGQVRIKHLGTDAEVIAWYRRLRQWHETRLSAKELGLPQKDWTEVVTETDEAGRKTQRRVDRMLATRELPLLARESGVKRLELPQLQGGDPRPFEVVGIPLAEPGYQVVEIESRRLGEALLDKAAPMYVRTGVLLTNLGVHFKQGRENAAVWVTTLDRGRPVAQAEVAVSDCRGQRLWAGRTDDQGLARIAEALPRPARCDEGEALFVSARKADERGVVDMAFVVDGWAKGIEPWRFNLPTSESTAPDLRAHTVFDRTLLRAGETVSMKHFVRRESLQGVSMPAAAERPTRVKITHEGSGDEVVLPIAWSGERSATSSWNIPGAAKLGQYRVELDNPQAPADRRRTLPAGDFRVEAFRVPLLDARLSPPRTQPVAPAEVLLSAQLNWMNGGPVAAAPLRGSALLRPRELRFAGYEDWRFDPPRELKAGTPEPSDEDTPERGEGQLVADKLPLTTDREGAAAFRVKPLPPVKRPSELLAEVSFNDPNGEVQTVATTVPLWPSAVVLGLRTQGWVRHKGEARFHVVALDTAGRVIKGQEVEVRGRLQR
ncbi:MAG: alpha-2-macroglobulin, partial [Rubrivivax sp.]|nr:alpha-2-macroglobulin [Rubrivivax sp.]